MITKVDENKALQPQKDAGLTKPQDKNLTSLKAAPELIEGRAGQQGGGGRGGPTFCSFCNFFAFFLQSTTKI